MWEQNVEAEGEANNQDDEEYGDLEEGEDDILEDDDVDPDTVEEPHLDEQVDPGEGDGDGSDLPMMEMILGRTQYWWNVDNERNSYLPVKAGGVPEEVVAGHKEPQAVDEKVEEEDKRQLWFSEVPHFFETFPHLPLDWMKFTVQEENDYSCQIEE